MTRNIKIYNLNRVHYTKINVEPFTYNLQNQEHLNNLIYKAKCMQCANVFDTITAE